VRHSGGRRGMRRGLDRSSAGRRGAVLH
jgi:hypothetical protein